MQKSFPLLARMLQRLSYQFNRAAYWANGQSPQDASRLLLDEYIAGVPTPQNAVDILPGWCQTLPPHVKVKAGTGSFYADPRILWAIEQLGSLKDKKVLELGPLEASHTYMLEKEAPAFIHAIEANRTAFLRCLVVKELLDLKRARFFLGDFMPWLQTTDTRYDFIVASGVLYHMRKPFELLELMAGKCDAFYLWTHYFDETAMPPGDRRRKAFLDKTETEMFHGTPVTLHQRSYFSAWRDKAFCGGMYDLHNWVEKKDILAAIKALGFDDIRIAHDEPAHQNGPSFSVFARRAKSGSAA